MLRAMYSGVSGLRNHQTKLDVIGNNIANVNTHGFKKSRIIFKDLFSQSSGSASGATGARGGTNPKQVGLGVQLSAIDTMHSTGASQNSSSATDMMINGDGFFIVGEYTPEDGKPTAGEGPENLKYTRAGNFYLDADGYLVNSDGYYLVGSAAEELSSKSEDDEGEGVNLPDKPDIKGEGENLKTENGSGPFDVEGLGPIKLPIDAQQLMVSRDGTISYNDYKGDVKYAGQLVLAKFSNPGGLMKDGSNYYLPTPNSGNVFAQVGQGGGIGEVMSNVLEMSNVDLSEEFTEIIVAQRGFQANSRIITTSDEILQELVNLKR